jgi:sensor histidine kinase regulating citrate/malate metabolism
VRAAVAKRDTEPLRVAKDNVSTKLPRRLKQGEAEEIGTDCDQCSPTLRGLYEGAQIVNAAGFVRALNDGAEHSLPGKRGRQCANDEFDTQRFGTSP